MKHIEKTFCLFKFQTFEAKWQEINKIIIFSFHHNPNQSHIDKIFLILHTLCGLYFEKNKHDNN